MINRYLIGFVVVILMLLFGIILLFSGGGEKPASTTAPVVKPLPEYSITSAETSMTIRGEINGDDVHRSIRITVGQYDRRLDVIAGYQGQVIQTNTFSNNQSAYSEFLYAIKDAGFMLKRKGVTDAQAQPNGKCPLGNLYTYELNAGGESLSDLWSSSCGSKTGTLGGSSSLLQTLFQNQITNYSQLTSGVQL